MNRFVYKYMKYLENELKTSYRKKFGSKTSLKIDNLESYDDHNFFDYNENVRFVNKLIGNDVSYNENKEDKEEEEPI